MQLTGRRVIDGALLAAMLSLAPVLVRQLVLTPLLMAPPAAVAGGLLALRKADWIGYAVLAVALTRADAWMTSVTGAPFGTITVAVIVTAFAVVMRYTDRRLTAPTPPFRWYALFLAAGLLVGALFGDHQYAAAWSRDAVAALLTFVTVFCFSSDGERLRNALKLAVVCGAVVSAVNVVELFNPSLVGMSHSDGRAAGLLKNANVSAFVVTASFVVLQLYRRMSTGVSAWLMVAVQALMMIGVLATFSRGGMVLLAISMIATVCIELRHGNRPWSTLAAAALATVAAVAAVRYFLQTSDLAVLNYFRKIMTFAGGEVDDNYRFELAGYYLEKFLDRPIAGYGFNAAVSASAANADLHSGFGVQGPHNTALSIVVDFGAVTLLIYMAFLASLYRGLRRVGPRAPRQYATLLFAILCARHVFQHDLYLSRPAMAFFALLAVLPAILPGDAFEPGKTGGPAPPAKPGAGTTTTPGSIT